MLKVHNKEELIDVLGTRNILWVDYVKRAASDTTIEKLILHINERIDWGLADHTIFASIKEVLDGDPVFTEFRLDANRSSRKGSTEGLERVRNLCSELASEAQVAEQLGMDPGAFSAKKKYDADFGKAVEEGREMFIQSIKDYWAEHEGDSWGQVKQHFKINGPAGSALLRFNPDLKELVKKHTSKGKDAGQSVNLLDPPKAQEWVDKTDPEEFAKRFNGGELTEAQEKLKKQVEELKKGEEEEKKAVFKFPEEVRVSDTDSFWISGGIWDVEPGPDARIQTLPKRVKAAAVLSVLGLFFLLSAIAAFFGSGLIQAIVGLFWAWVAWTGFICYRLRILEDWTESLR